MSMWHPNRHYIVYYCFLHQIFRSSTASDGLQNGMKHFFKEHSYSHATSHNIHIYFINFHTDLLWIINIFSKHNVQKNEIALLEWTSFNNISLLQSCLTKQLFTKENFLWKQGQILQSREWSDFEKFKMHWYYPLLMFVSKSNHTGN